MNLLKLILVALMMLTATGAHARNTVIGLSPYGTPDAQMDLIRQVVSYLSESAGPGETARLVNAASLTLIAEFNVPDKAAYEQPRAKIKANRDALRALAAFAKASDADPARTSSIDLPGFLRHVGRNWPASVESDLIVIGSPIHQDPTAPAFDMTEARVPGDGHLLVSRDRSPYGAVGQGNGLAQYRVYFATLNDDWASNDRHAFHVERFISLSVTARGGTMAAFTADLSTLLGQAAAGAGGIETFTRQDTDKVEMIKIAAPVAEEADLGSIYERDVTNVLPKEDDLRAARNVELAISWQCACDLDLYVLPTPDSELLYFENPKTADGVLEKEFAGAPPASQGFERVMLPGPVDLRHALFRVNFFKGEVDEKVIGTVFLSIDGTTWSTPIDITATKGNGLKLTKEDFLEGTRSTTEWTIVGE